jgi:site-specific DNA recombinase
MTKNAKGNSGNKTDAVIYLRVSTEEQAKNNSLGNQEVQTRQLCETLGYRVDKAFIEQCSAKTDDRPQLQDMLRYCERNHQRIAAVVVWKFDRWARNAADHLALKTLLRKRNISLKSVCETTDDSPSGMFMESVFAAAAQYDNDVRAQRTSDGMRASLAKGRWTFQLPLGYVKRDGRVQVDPVAGPLLREAFERFATGSYSKDQVLAAVTRRGLRTIKGRTISPRDFGRILRNRLYAGIIDAMQVGAAADFQALIDRATFDRVQARLDGRMLPARAYVKSHPDFPLRHFVRCGCGRPLTGSWSKGRSKRYAFYHCPNAPCRERRRKDDFEGAFLDLVKRLQPNPQYSALFFELLREEAAQNVAQVRARRQRLSHEMTVWEGKRQKLREKFLYDGAISEDLFREETERIDAQITELRAELSLLDDRSEDQTRDLLRFAERVFVNAAVLWDRAALDQRQRLQQAYFPGGLSYAAGSFRTADISPFFNSLEHATAENGGVASPAGFEPAFWP